MNTLDEQIEKASAEKALRYPLMKFKDSLKEIREISEMAQDYIVTLQPDVLRPNRWEVIPQITIDFIDGVLKYIDERKTTEASEVYLNIGKLMTVSVEYATTTGANKDGTLNPKVTIGSDLRLETKEYDDDISIDQADILNVEECRHLPAQFFDDRKVMKEICTELVQKLHTNYGIVLGKDWSLIPLCAVAFFRSAKEWLIKHKDDGECGVQVKLGDILTFGIEKEGPDDDVEYYAFIAPGQSFKQNRAKSDDATENDD